MFIPPYCFINFDELFPHTYMIGRHQQIEIYCYDRVDKEGSRLERTLDFDPFDLGGQLLLNPNNVTQIHSNFSRNELFATFFSGLTFMIWTCPKQFDPT